MSEAANQDWSRRTPPRERMSVLRSKCGSMYASIVRDEPYVEVVGEVYTEVVHDILGQAHEAKRQRRMRGERGVYDTFSVIMGDYEPPEYLNSDNQ